MKKWIFAAGLLAALLSSAEAARAADAGSPLGALIERLLPGHAKDFIIQTIPAPAGENVFAVGSQDGKIILGGDTTLSQAVALNWYLKHDAFVDVSWYADDPVVVPAKLPLPSEDIRRTTRIKDRFFLNYCTFGYTMPFWRWRDWQRCIDWMALNGVNLPLAQTGNEYIWQKAWRSFGLSDEEIRAFFTGPAYLPWHRMANLDQWDGPLPQNYIDGQHDLEQKILARERELGMSPVLGAFAGHVPEALRVRQPALKIERIPPGWGGFSNQFGCWFLDPLDPKFKEIQVRFLQEQQKEYGTSHYYSADPFNEITPPSWEPAYLARVSQAIYDGMSEADSNAVWLQMAWTFQTRQQWTDQRLSAMIDAVPRGRMILLDYDCASRELFRETRAFYGAPFFWDYLGNFGGNTFLAGPVDRINRRLTAVISNPTVTNFVGVGATLEGLNNPIVYEMLFDRVWAGTNLDLAAWMRDEAGAHAGGPDPNVAAAWDLLRRKILVDGAYRIGGHGVIFQDRNPTLRGESGGMLTVKITYDNTDLIRAWGLLLRAGPVARKSSAYQRDLVDVTRQALGNLGLTLRQKMADADDRHDAAAFKAAADQFLALGGDLDKFLGTRTEFMLGKWIGDARSWGVDKSEQAYFEKDARRIITVWGGDLTDYAGRQWNGLMRDYYLPRWQLLIDATLSELRGGKPVDRPALQKLWHDHDWKFASSVGPHYTAEPHGDAFSMSRALYKKYVQ